MLGIGPDGELVKFNELGYRGSGPFLQKQSKSMGVIFVKNSGQQFGDLSSIEIDGKLQGAFNRELTGDARQGALEGIIDDNFKDGSIPSTDLYNFLNNKPHNNALLNHLQDEQLGNVDPIKLRNSIKNKIEETDYILVSIPPIDGKDIVANYLDINQKKIINCKWITYLSATSVYGDHKGDWVNEDSATQPTSDNGTNRFCLLYTSPRPRD